jgi:hypothetical protein
MSNPAAPQEKVALHTHGSLAPLLELSERTGYRFGFIGDPRPRSRNWYDRIPIAPLRQFLHLQTIHCRMAQAILRAPQPDVFFLFTINLIYSLPIYVSLLLRGRPAFFLVHGSQQTAERSALHRAAFALCQFAVRCAELYPVHLELDDDLLPAGARFEPEKSLCVPHPHPLAEKPLPPAQREGPLRVGIVGLLRGDKPVDEIFRLLAGMQEELGIRLVLGTPRWQRPEWVDALPVEVIDTWRDADYFACLAGLDVLIVDFRRADYWFRPSGVIIDAAMSGCAALCPDFPVMAAEITNPVRVGHAFDELREVPELLREMRTTLRATPPDFAAWREPRRMEKIAPLFTAFLEKRGVKPTRSGPQSS